MSAGRYGRVLLLFATQRFIELLYSERNERQIHRRQPDAPQAGAALGWVACVSALALRLSVLVSLRESWNVRAVVPSDLRIVDRGPYRFIRHPNYVALGLEFLGLPLIGGAYASAVGLSLANALLLRRRIREEDALLMAIPAYRQRMAGKPRFLPRLFSGR